MPANNKLPIIWSMATGSYRRAPLPLFFRHCAPLFVGWESGRPVDAKYAEWPMCWASPARRFLGCQNVQESREGVGIVRVAPMNSVEIRKAG